MDEELRYRAELADQFLTRLAALTPAQWRDFMAARASDPHYYAFALELAEEATRLLGDERRAPHERMLRDRMRRVDALVDALTLPESERTVARHLAHAAVQACLVRDALGFNPGAFGELLRPFRAHLDVDEVERSASHARTPPRGTAPVDDGPR